MRTLALVATLLVVATSAFAAPSIVGDFQGWDPADPGTELTIDANGIYVYTHSFLAGSYVYKAVDGDTWGLDFPGNNQPITLAADDDVTFYVNLGATVGVKEGDEYVFDSVTPPIVCGDFMSELGGVDWDQTDTSTTVMADGDGDGIWVFQSIIPAGSYAFKIVLNNNWDQNTSPSGNIVFVSDGATPVTFSYDMSNNTTDVQTSAPPAVIDVRIDGDGTDATLYLVQFSEDMDQTTAETPANYVVTGGVGGAVVTSAVQDADASLVHLTVSPALAEGYDYQFTVTGVTSVGGTPVDPSSNTDCFYLHLVTLELNMDLYIDANGVPTSVHVQGDTHPLTWDQCGGAETFDADADSMYSVDEYFTMGYVCGASAESVQVKYKYVVDCATWEGDYDFGHYVTLDPNAASQVANVWWEDIAPSDNTTCDVGVRFQVTELPDTFDILTDVIAVHGSIAPLDWAVDTVLHDDGTNGDLTAGDGVFSVLVTFPTGSYKFLEYKYAINDVFECDTYPNRALTLDDVDGCMATRTGPMELMELWDWCDTVVTVPETQLLQERSWGVIKSMYR